MSRASQCSGKASLGYDCQSTGVAELLVLEIAFYGVMCYARTRSTRDGASPVLVQMWLGRSLTSKTRWSSFRCFAYTAFTCRAPESPSTTSAVCVRVCVCACVRVHVREHVGTPAQGVLGILRRRGYSAYSGRHIPLRLAAPHGTCPRRTPAQPTAASTHSTVARPQVPRGCSTHICPRTACCAPRSSDASAPKRLPRAVWSDR